MTVTLSQEKRKMIATMLENGANNGRIALKFPGIRKSQIAEIRNGLNQATEQTKRKLKRDPLLNIYRSGDIGMSELHSAEYIRYAFSLITADVSLRVMDFTDFIDVIGSKPTDEEGVLKTRVQDQYAAWFDECSKKRIKVGPIIHLLTEPVTLRETDKYYAFRNGRTRGYVVEGLKLYSKMYSPNKGLE